MKIKTEGIFNNPVLDAQPATKPVGFHPTQSIATGGRLPPPLLPEPLTQSLLATGSEWGGHSYSVLVYDKDLIGF